MTSQRFNGKQITHNLLKSVEKIGKVTSWKQSSLFLFLTLFTIKILERAENHGINQIVNQCLHFLTVSALFSECANNLVSFKY